MHHPVLAHLSKMEFPYEDATVIPSILPSMSEYEMMRELEVGQFELWKSSLNFTGENPEFPVEIFALIMEKKYKLLTKRCIQIAFSKKITYCPSPKTLISLLDYLKLLSISILLHRCSP